MSTLVLGATAASVLAGPARAQAPASSTDDQGYYIRLDLGGGIAGQAGATGASVSGEVDDAGQSPLGGLGIGYRFNRYLRADITAAYAGGYELDDNDASGRRHAAEIDSWTALANLYLEYPLGSWSPYLTAGVGAGRNKTGTLTRDGLADVEGDTTTGFAWQAGLGVGYALAPDWTIDAGYRYLDAGEFRSRDAATGGALSGELRTHLVLVGLRFSFGGPMSQPAAAPAMPMAAPAPAPPPPEPPRDAARGVPELPVLYRVFFDWNKAEITADSARILRDAASTAKAAQAQVTRIVATGHADRSGAERYNMALSLRRANAVKTLLVRDGVPENQIVVVGRGERESLTPTADGVREPLNRRVEIVIE